MSCLIGIINYGIAGNIKSISKAVEAAGANTLIINNPDQLEKADKLVLPGVGSFPDAIKELANDGLIDPLKECMREKLSLGICLGMQILAKIGFEFGKNEGLGLFDAEVKPMICSAAVPHMGFNKIFVQKENLILSGLNNKSFYFMHSYEMVNYKDVLSLSCYAGHEFVSAIGNDNIFGVQFHPEKSREAGIQLFKNFINL